MTQNLDAQILIIFTTLKKKLLHGQNYTINKVKCQMTNYKKYFLVYIRDKGLISLIQK